MRDKELWSLRILFQSIGLFIQTNPAAIKYLMVYLACCLLVIIATITFVTTSLSRSVLAPIRDLTKAANSIKEGNLDFQVLGSNYEELDHLCEVFDNMRVELKQSKDQEVQLREERSMLLANLSHDLKTPITSIKGYVEGIRDGVADTPEKLDKYLDTIYAKSIMIDEMVSNLSTFSKLELSRMDFKFSVGDFNEFIREVCEEYRMDLAKHDMELKIKMEPGPAYVKLDYEKMHRVFANLFDNAIKYRGDGTGTVTVTTRRQNGGVFAMIADTGIGIDEDKLKAVFDSFYRVDTARTLNIKGSGLGLGIAKQVVEKHGGRIWLKSNEQNGTTAAIYLPAAQPVKRQEI